jgi:hypothetical protein
MTANLRSICMAPSLNMLMVCQQDIRDNICWARGENTAGTLCAKTICRWLPRTHSLPSAMPKPRGLAIRRLQAKRPDFVPRQSPLPAGPQAWNRQTLGRVGSGCWEGMGVLRAKVAGELWQIGRERVFRARTSAFRDAGEYALQHA